MSEEFDGYRKTLKNFFRERERDKQIKTMRLSIVALLMSRFTLRLQLRIL